MSTKRRVEVFLAVTPVFRKEHTSRDPLPTRWAAAWVTRRTTTDLYTSKTTETREEAVRLALRWLDRQNRTSTDREYVDTTGAA